MQINFKTLNLTNFKNHQSLTVNFGERTVVTGDNAEGKSSISEAVTWLLYGTDTVGSKLDPTPTTYESDSTHVELSFDVDGVETSLGRELVKGKAKYFVNEVPSKASEFNESVEQLYDKDLFLSLFNPNYFFTMHWEKQRGMVLQYVTAPANKEVFKELPKLQAEKLSVLVKKHLLDELDKIHRNNKNKLEKTYIAAQSRTKTLKDQLDEQAPRTPLESLQAELSQFVKARNEIEQSIEGQQDTNSKINVLQNQINALNKERDHIKEMHGKVKGEQIQDTCRTCKQTLQDEAIKAVEADKEHRIEQVKSQFNQTISKRKELEEELKTLEFIDVSEQLKKAHELQEKIMPIEREISMHKQFEAMQEQVKQAQEDEQKTLETLNDSIFILDAIKAFRSKEAELQAKKVQDLLENLSIKLFDVVKSTGELKPTFEIMMDGKEHKKLSLSESIRAGLELRDVLSEQSDLILPCFVDNSESITRFKEPNGQLIMAKVVAGQELKIESEEITNGEI